MPDPDPDGLHDPEPIQDFSAAVAAVRAGASPDEQARRLYLELDDQERLGLLDGDLPFWDGLIAMGTEGYNRRPYVHGAVARLGIPGIRFVDGPRGCVAGHGTAFPVSMARGATWDPELEEEVGQVIGREVRAQGGNFFGGVCLNLPRHPAWGRAQETYGDDPHHLGEMAAGLVRGTQHHVMACAKHFALNSMENARFTVDVTVDEATLHDVYLPHFERVVAQGVAGVMSAYNSVNGEWAGQSPALLTQVLRQDWGFEGITVSDFIWGLRDAAASLDAGLDLEEPCRQQRAQHLAAQLEDGQTSWDQVERSGVRLLATQLRAYAAHGDPGPGPDPEPGSKVELEGEAEQIMAAPASRQLARRVAARAMVLLRNEAVDDAALLPLDPAAVSSLALIGRLADQPNLGDRGSSMVRPPSSVTPLDGLTAAFADTRITLVTDDDPAGAAQAAADAQVAVVVVGFDAHDEGEYVGGDTMRRPELLALFPPLPDALIEAGLDLDTVVMSAGPGFGGDRASLALRPVDEQVIAAVAGANPRTVVVLVAAGAVLTKTWRHQVPAVVLMWYPGMEGGHALADVLTGAHNPSGRLPFSIPTSAEHLPDFDRDATAVTYDRFHGQRLLDRLGVPAAFPHGFGLSYTRYAIESAEVVDRRVDHLTLAVSVANRGGRDGHHVVQVYGRRATGSYAGELLLAGFASVWAPAGHTVDHLVDVSAAALAEWDPDTRRVPPDWADVVLEVGAFAHDPDALVVHPTH